MGIWFARMAAAAILMIACAGLLRPAAAHEGHAHHGAGHIAAHAPHVAKTVAEAPAGLAARHEIATSASERETATAPSHTCMPGCCQGLTCTGCGAIAAESLVAGPPTAGIAVVRPRSSEALASVWPERLRRPPRFQG
jgi:hypothetical protein